MNPNTKDNEQIEQISICEQERRKNTGKISGIH